MNTHLAVTNAPRPAAVAPPASTRRALAGLALAMALSSLGTSIANVSLPTLARAFAATFPEVQWVVLAYLVAVTALIVGVGRLGDLVGRRRLLLAGLALFSVASALCGLAPNLGLLIAARALQGLGAAAMMALTLALVGTLVPPSGLGRVMGLLGTMSAIGTALGPSLGGLLLAGFGWRAIFLAPIPLGVLALALVQRHLPADPGPPPATAARFDVAGTLLLAFALASYALALTLGRGTFGSTNVTLLAAAAVATGLFVRVEGRTAFPLVRLAGLQDSTLRTGLITSGLVSTVMMATLIVGPFHLSVALGLSAAEVGLVLSVGPLVTALMGVPAGHLSDRLGAARVTVLGLAGLAGGSTVLALLPAPHGLAGYLAPIVVLTAGYALFQTANNTAVMRDRPAAERGVASGLLNLARNLGLVTGASVMGAVFVMATRTTDLASAAPAAVATGMRVTFATAALLVVGALALVGADRAAARRADARLPSLP